MPTKRALIVDDSKSARVVLSRVLEKLQLSVDTTESAESALVYLRENRPDVIFMDHVMSGMDGLQAVQAIKNDPATASIPIMMYTSQDGELYAGEARALGAAGVLPKQMAPADITKALHQLEILRDGRDGQPADFDQVRLPAVGAPPEGAAPVTTAVGADAVEAAPPPAPASPVAAEPAWSLADVRATIEPLVRDQGLDLRRFVVATLESVGTRVITDVTSQVEAAARAAAAATIAALPPPAPVIVQAPEPPPRPRPTAWIVALVAAFAAAAAAGAYAFQQHTLLEELRDRNAAQAREIASAQASLDAVRAANAVPPATAARLAVPYGEAHLSGDRLAALGKLIADLAQHGYAGRVRVTTSVGNFCLTGNPSEGYQTAPGEMVANRCDLVGNPFDEGLAPAAREPAAVQQFVAATRGRPQGAIEVLVTSAPRAPAEGAYPTTHEVTAAEWNAAAARLNYVEFTLEPRPAAR